MVFIPAKDRREGLTFFVFPSLPYGRRLGAAFFLFFAGLALQLFAGRALFGAPFVMAASLLLLMRGFHNRPRETVAARDEDWESVGLDRFKQVKSLVGDAVRWDKDFLDITCWRGVAGFLLFQLHVFFGWRYLVREGFTPLDVVFLIDAELMLAPQWFTGLRRIWKPDELLIKTECLVEAALLVRKLRGPREYNVQPMMQMARGESGRYPVDAKLLVVPEDKPEEFIGLQIQVSLNNVQGTYFPYLYCVLLARKGFGLEAKTGAPRSSGGIIIEFSGGDDEVEIMVLRATTEAGGFHTRPRKRASIVMEALAYTDKARGKEERTRGKEA